MKIQPTPPPAPVLRGSAPHVGDPKPWLRADNATLGEAVDVAMRELFYSIHVAMRAGDRFEDSMSWVLGQLGGTNEHWRRAMENLGIDPQQFDHHAGTSFASVISGNGESR
jgi:hypothetical protein